MKIFMEIKPNAIYTKFSTDKKQFSFVIVFIHKWPC